MVVGADTETVPPTMAVIVGGGAPLPSLRPSGIPAGDDATLTVPVFGWMSRNVVALRPSLSVTVR